MHQHTKVFSQISQTKLRYCDHIFSSPHVMYLRSPRWGKFYSEQVELLTLTPIKNFDVLS